MSILDKIVATKKKEVALNKELYPVKLLEKSLYYSARPVSLKRYIEREDMSGIIAEIKRKSPSRGMLNEFVSIEELSIGYMAAGAAALSVLTDHDYFAGSNGDLTKARKFNFCPILRKDFILDEYQIVEAKSIGADAVLLIARLLTPQQIKSLSKFAKSLGLEVLLEIHSERELREAYSPEIDLLGVNNRDLDTLVTDLKLSRDMAPLLPAEVCKVSESGINDPAIALELRKLGYRGFLIGEFFMRSARPERACAKFIHELQKLTLQAGDA